LCIKTKLQGGKPFTGASHQDLGLNAAVVIEVYHYRWIIKTDSNNHVMAKG